MNIWERMEQIRPADQTMYRAVIDRWDTVAKPLKSLGKLELLLAKIAAAGGTDRINMEKKCVLVFCADNGVLAQGVAQSTCAVTTAIAGSLAAGTTSVNAMADAAGADVFPIDVGMIDTVPHVLDRKIACGTGDLSCGPAMTRQQAEQALKIGIDLVEEKSRSGYSLIAVGEAGIGNTTTSSAVAAVLLDLPVKLLTGRGSGLTDEGLRNKLHAITCGIKINAPVREDPVDVLSKVGGFDLASMTGAFLGGAIYHVPMVIDGLISSVAALCAVRLCPAVKDYLIPSHMTAEPAGRYIMEELELDPILHAQLCLGEGTGAVALFPLLDMALAVYDHAATFSQIRMEAYQKL